MIVKGKVPGGFGHSKKGASVLYLPAEGPPGAWSVDGFRLRDLKTVTIGDLPARFDWSIIGCTILLLAFMNLRKVKRRRRRMVKGGGQKRKEKRQKQKHRKSFTQNKFKQKC